MEILLPIAGLILLDLAALRWGSDSRSIARGNAGAGGLLPQEGGRGTPQVSSPRRAIATEMPEAPRYSACPPPSAAVSRRSNKINRAAA